MYGRMELLTWPKTSLCTVVILVAVALVWGQDGGQLTSSFEAAFQGECHLNNPCQHLCFDLHDGTFECSCKEGFTLAKDGYACIEDSKISDSDLNSTEEDAFQRSSEEWTKNSREILHTKHRRPGSHKHFKIRSKYFMRKDNRNWYEVERTEPRDDTEFEFVSYVRQNTHYPRGRLFDSLRRNSGLMSPTQYSSGVKQVIGSESPSSLSTTPLSNQDYETFEPINPVPVTTLPNHLRSLSCDQLFCQNGGKCLPNLEVDGFKCKCPESSEKICDNIVKIRTPRFLTDSYMSFPPITDAKQSLRLELSFRPEAYEGLLLYSGGKADLKGDFFALSLNGGFLELRFDCGTGEGVVHSDQPVTLHSWNKVVIHRDGWDAWMQLNNGQQVQGRSQGSYSRITFQLPLYLGGSPNLSAVANRTQSRTGFKGCVRHLQINSKVYNFGRNRTQDITEGFDIEECSSDICNTITCVNGGQCIASGPGRGSCSCPLGFGGNRCQNAIDIIVPSFNGSSYLQFPGLASSSLSFTEILMVFKPFSPTGLLLYNGGRKNGTGDFMCISLVRGYVEVRFDLGSGTTILRSAAPIAINQWHVIFVTRTGREGILHVDNQPPLKGLTHGAFTQLSVPLNLYIGGLPQVQDVAKQASMTTSFTGCVQRVEVNGRPLKLLEQALSGVNIANCYHMCIDRPCLHGGTCVPMFDSYTCHCPLGYTGTDCGKAVLEMVSEPMFLGNSYLHYADEEILSRLQGRHFDVRLQFRSLAPSGLILWAGNTGITPYSDYVAVILKNGYLQLLYNLGSGEADIPYSLNRVDDGQWYSLRITRISRHGSLSVDDGPIISGFSPGPLKELNISGGLYLGGVPETIQHQVPANYSGFYGCISNFTLSSELEIHLVTHATTGINIQPCL